MLSMVSVKQDILDTLCLFTCDAHSLFAPSRDEIVIDKKAFNACSNFLKKYKCEWKVSTQSFEFKFNAEDFINNILATGQAPKPNPLAYHPTSPELVQECLNLAGIDKHTLSGVRFLEPNGGSGAFLDAIKAMASEETVIEACELDPINRYTLKEKGYSLVGDDFLEFSPSKPYQAIAMNPPFSVKGNSLAWLDHVEHAFSMLSDYGDLVAIIPRESFFNTSSRRVSDFRDFCFNQAGFSMIEFPAGSFASAKAIETVAIHLKGTKAGDPSGDYGIDSDWHSHQYRMMVENDGTVIPILKEFESYGYSLNEIHDMAVQTANECDLYLPESRRNDFINVLLSLMGDEEVYKAEAALLPPMPVDDPAQYECSNIDNDIADPNDEGATIPETDIEKVTTEEFTKTVSVLLEEIDTTLSTSIRKCSKKHSNTTVSSKSSCRAEDDEIFQYDLFAA